MGLTIRGITALRTKMPLVRPYHLSLVTLNSFDSILVRIEADGKEGFGETTGVPGYFSETPDDLKDDKDLITIYGYQDPMDADDEAEREDISTVEISIHVEEPAGREGMVQRTYSTRVRCRNAGF